MATYCHTRKGRIKPCGPQRHQERLRSSSPQISQKDADFEIQIGEIGESADLLASLGVFPPLGHARLLFLSDCGLRRRVPPDFAVAADEQVVYRRPLMRQCEEGRTLLRDDLLVNGLLLAVEQGEYGNIPE